MEPKKPTTFQRPLEPLQDKKVLTAHQLPCPSILRELGVSFCAFFPHNRTMNILQQIFTDHYEEMIYTLHPRPVVITNVDRMLLCGDHSQGGAMYSCPHCGNMKFVPFRCHSRFCPSCGVKYAQERATSMSFKLLSCPHRHCVFTIDERFRHFFLRTAPSLTASSRLSEALSSFYSINLINPKTLSPASSVSSIPLAGLHSGTHISTALLPRAVSPTTPSGAM